MNTNSLDTKKIIYGFDLLKFILALLIIAGHTSLFEEYSSLSQFRENLSSIAVPTFMAISAFLFFKKIYSKQEGEESKVLLIKTVKRLAILFLCWYVLMLPMTYFKFFSVANFKETIFAIFMSCTFNGYWFIKALIINTCIFYFCRNGNKLVICTIISWFLYLFFSYNYIYHFIDFPYHPYYSFYYNMAFYSVGVLFARYGQNILSKNVQITLIFILWFVLFLLGFMKYFNPLYKLLSIPLIFLLFYHWNLNPKPLYKTLRDMSIILYMVHFALIWLYDGVCKISMNQESTLFNVMQLSIIRFIIISLMAIIIALLIIKNENKPRLSFLKYLH